MRQDSRMASGGVGRGQGDPIGRCTGWGFPGGGDWAVDPLRLALSVAKATNCEHR